MNWDAGCKNPNYRPDGPEFYPSLHVSDGPGFKNQAIEIQGDPGLDLISFGAFAVPSRFRVYVPQGAKSLNLNFFGEGNGALCGATCRFQKAPQLNYCAVRPDTWQGLPWKSGFTLAKAEADDFQSNVQGGGFSFVQYFRKPGLDAGGWLYIKTFDVDDDQGFYQVQYVLQVWKTRFITWLNNQQTQWDSQGDPLPLIGGEIVPQPVDVKLVGDIASPASIGQYVEFTAKGSGGSGQYEYRFWFREGSVPWQSKQEYSGVNTWAWKPDKVGTFGVGVHVRTQGSSFVYEALATITYEVVDSQKHVTVTVNDVVIVTGWPVKIEVK